MLWERYFYWKSIELRNARFPPEQKCWQHFCCEHKFCCDSRIYVVDSTNYVGQQKCCQAKSSQHFCCEYSQHKCCPTFMLRTFLLPNRICVGQHKFCCPVKFLQHFCWPTVFVLSTTRKMLPTNFKGTSQNDPFV